MTQPKTYASVGKRRHIVPRGIRAEYPVGWPIVAFCKSVFIPKEPEENDSDYPVCLECYQVEIERLFALSDQLRDTAEEAESEAVKIELEIREYYNDATTD